MSLSNFPLAHQNFILSFSGTVKYVDIVNGLDSNNGDTGATAYRTLEHAQSTTSAISTAVMYVINPGTYDLQAAAVSGPQGTSSAAFLDGNLPRTFFCAPDGQVVFQWTAGAQRDSCMVSLQNASSAVYGGVFKRNNNGKADSYAVAMFNGTTAYCQGDFYNCVFIETNANGNWSLHYDNSSANNATVNNCTFVTIENGIGDWSSASAGLVLNDCAFNYTYGAGSAVKNNTVINQTINATSYELSTDNSTYGVYSGTYAWGQPIVGVSFQINGSDVIAANEGQIVTVAIVGSIETGTLNYTISGVSSTDINGASLTGTVNLVNYEASFDITLTEDISSGEGIENLTVVMEDPTGNQQATLTVNDTSAVLYVTPTAVSGDTITVRLNTSNTPEVNGTQIPYTISGDYITASNIGQPLTGNFTVNNNIAELIINLGAIVSTTLTVTAYGETTSCTITFISDIDVDVVTQISQPIYQSSMIGSLLDGVTAPISYGIPIGSQVDDAKTIAIPKPDLIEVEPFITVTTSDNGKLNNFVNLPLGAEIIKEYWI